MAADAVIGILAGMLPIMVTETPKAPVDCDYMDDAGNISKQQNDLLSAAKKQWRRDMCDVPTIDSLEELVGWFRTGKFSSDKVRLATEISWRAGPFANM